MVTDMNRRIRRFGGRGEQTIEIAQKTVRRVLRSQCLFKSDIGNPGDLYVVDNHYDVKWRSSQCILLRDIGNFCRSLRSGFIVDCPRGSFGESGAWGPKFHLFGILIPVRRPWESDAVVGDVIVAVIDPAVFRGEFGVLDKCLVVPFEFAE